jgi:2,4-dienoyl-CoA reductase-like NADH-dependent reductase (Old Yellow Enzyme family)
MRLLEKVRIGKLELNNRIVMPPMNTELASESGEVTRELIEHYSARAPWLGMVVVEHSYVVSGGRLSPRQPGVYDDRLVEGLTGLAEAVKSTGARVAIQINHAGEKCKPDLIGEKPVAPSPSNTARALTGEEIAELTDAFGAAAARAADSGFDAVEIHGSHGFLLSQFQSPLKNRRQDEYGGSLKNRMRFPVEVVRRVRREIGSGVQLWYRLGADDRIEGGNTIEDGTKMAGILASEGVDVFDVSGGICGSRPPGLDGPGYFAYAASAVGRATGLPVVAVGGITTPSEAEEVLERWSVDLVAVGRALLEDPLWGKSAQEIG